MNYYMIIEPLIKNAYWCSSYANGIKDEIKRNKGMLFEINFQQLSNVTDYAKSQNLRPVLIINCISNKWIYNCITRLNQLQIHPLLLAPYNFVPHMPASTVTFDFINAFYSLCQYLHQSNHHKIALFGVNPNSSNDITKKRAYLMFADDYKIDKANDKIFWNKGNLEKCCKEFFIRIGEFDAVVCSNDIVAVKLISYLKEHNIDVPKDIFVATMGNTALSKFITPNITISQINCEQIGRQAVKLNTMLAKNRGISSLSATVTGEILPRKSTDYFPFSDIIGYSPTKINSEDINFYCDEDVKKIFNMEQLITGCDELDIKILYGLTCNKRIAELANELFITENTVKYRIRKMQNLTQSNSRKELIELYIGFIY